MKAIVVRELGGPEVLRLQEVPDPQPGAGEVLVRLRAAGVNPVETYVRAGAHGRSPQLPYTPGADGAGEVVAVGAGVAAPSPGDRVFVAGAPTYAELVAAPAAAVWALPDALTFEQGAAVGIPYRTACLALRFAAKGASGDRVLIRGGSGGVGTAAIQIAVSMGCRVVATAGTPEGLALVRELGADAAGHGDDDALRAASDGHGYDVIVEMLANVNLQSDMGLLAERGRVAVVGSRGRIEIDPRLLMARSTAVVGVMGMTAEERRRIHAYLDAGLRNGTLRPVVGPRFPLASAADAHVAVMSPGARGKVVLTVP